MEDGQTVGRRKFLTLLGLAPTAPLLTHITPGDIAAQTSGGRRRSADLSGIWFDIRDYGDISSGTITTALQATINAIGAGGACRHYDPPGRWRHHHDAGRYYLARSYAAIRAGR